MVKTLISIILPTYNEADSICLLIKEITKILNENNSLYELIVVDDNSPDGTAKRVMENFTNNEKVKLFIRKKEKGLATAIRYGIERSKGEVAVVMDTDFNHPPSLIPLLVKITEYFDIAIGSRYVIGGGMKTSKFRFIGSKFFNILTRYLLGVQTRDNLSGFVAFKKRILSDFNLSKIFYGYGDYFIRFLYLAQKQRKTIIEVPVVYEIRQGGTSKTNFYKEIIRYTLSVIKIRFGIWKEHTS
ncbi:MAG: glycosyltransferase [Methanosarcinales archaeon]